MSTTSSDWQRFFDVHAPKYLDEPYTKNTEAEVDFLVEELDLPSGGRVLDVGCGVGRHLVGLARRGYALTGIDLSSGMLAEARRAAQAAGVSVELIQADAAHFAVAEPFDAAIGLCEGALCLLGSQDDPIRRDAGVLRNIARALKPGAVFVTTVLSAFRFVRAFSEETIDRGDFDPTAMVMHNEVETASPEGALKFRSRERVYVPTELAGMLEDAGFAVQHVWGGTPGAWQRQRVRLDDWEIMAVARRSE